MTPAVYLANLISRVMAFGRMAPLEGSKLVRMVYMDEGGISQHEPFVVVSGVVIHGDQQLLAVEDYLESLTEKHLPQNDRNGFIFHAKDIFSGTKYFKDESQWPLERRFPILDDLVNIPGKFNLPIALGFMRKDDPRLSDIPEFFTGEVREIVYHAFAFIECVIHVEWLLRKHYENENALLIAENSNAAKKIIKSAHAVLRDKDCLNKTAKSAEEVKRRLNCLPLRRIRDTVHFAEKKECRLLQLADACTFALRGHLVRHKRNPQFYNPLRSQLIYVPSEEDRL